MRHARIRAKGVGWYYVATTLFAFALAATHSAAQPAASPTVPSAAQPAAQPAAAPAAALPALAGDGVTDDTAAIQARLDSRVSEVYLPPPHKHYVINKALRIHSNQTLRLDRFTVIRCAAKANDYLLTNADLDAGNRNIRVIGGIWDGNNLQNQCRQGERKGKHPRDFFIGSALLFMNVSDLTVSNLTVKDSERFGVHVAACRRFTVEDITFDFNLSEPSMDGVHLQGGCHEGRVANIKGNTSDDLIALNSDDSEYYEITQGPISDIQIDGLWATNGFRAVRFLCVSSPVRRVSISNIYGSFRRNVVAFTHWNFRPAAALAIEDISISNIFSAKATEPELAGKLGHAGERRTFAIIGIETALPIDNLTIANVFRREWFPDAAPTIRIQRGAKIGTLRLRDIQHVNMTDSPLVFFQQDGSIARLFVDGVVVREKTGAQKAIPLSGGGKILKQHGEFFTEGADELLEEAARVDADLKARPAEELRL
jgi:hypothetical protein